ncbi:MAG: hypothetical protein OER04_09205, partial [Cyclobacteriaceae bacterium]|nr:hypothetical protein [Cyclobacteriaceae bacterium]
GTATLKGALSFYDFLQPDFQNQKVHLCNGSACLLSGTQEELKRQLADHFSESEIGEMCCLGQCYHNRAFQYEGQNYSGKVDLRDILQNHPKPQADIPARSALEAPILLSSTNRIDSYQSLLEQVMKQSLQEIIEKILLSGLQGRGGAAFPMGQKLKACQAATSNTKFVVCNADEGDPGSFSDRYLLEYQPHAVIFGMLAAAFCIGASKAIFYIRAEYPESLISIQQACSMWESWLSKQRVFQNFEFKLIKGAGSYICGEESALLSSIEGQRPEVRLRPPYPTEQGLFHQPTLVNNVETLANIPFILEKGHEAYRKLGTTQNPGFKLLSLDGNFNRPGILEVEMGTPLHQVVYEFAGGFNKPVKALHIGGPLGGLVPLAKIKDLTVDFDSFRDQGFDLGHASIVCIPEDYPLIKYLEHLFEFGAKESCGKCFPCRLGTQRGWEMLQSSRDIKINRQLFQDLLDTMEMGSLCGFGKALPMPVKHAMKYFAEELNPYFQNET